MAQPLKHRQYDSAGAASNTQSSNKTKATNPLQRSSSDESGNVTRYDIFKAKHATFIDVVWPKNALLCNAVSVCLDTGGTKDIERLCMDLFCAESSILDFFKVYFIICVCF